MEKIFYIKISGKLFLSDWEAKHYCKIIADWVLFDFKTEIYTYDEKNKIYNKLRKIKTIQEANDYFKKLKVKLTKFLEETNYGKK